MQASRQAAIGAGVILCLAVCVVLAATLSLNPSTNLGTTGTDGSQPGAGDEPHEPPIQEWVPRPVGVDIRFSGVPSSPTEPSFVYVYFNGQNRMGGLWGIVDGVRTIDRGSLTPWNPRITHWWEGQLNATHWRAITWLDIGTRQADFYACNDSLLLQTTYNLTCEVNIADWYWEQCYQPGVDPQATFVAGYANGTVGSATMWRTGNFTDVGWFWLQYREWMTGKLRSVRFTLNTSSTIVLSDDHGNDVAAGHRAQCVSYTTRLEFDTPSVQRAPRCTGLRLETLPGKESFGATFATDCHWSKLTRQDEIGNSYP